MNDYILFMHNDAPDRVAAANEELWGQYLSRLRQTGQFDGGSSIGAGVCANKRGVSQALHDDLTGFLRIRAKNREDAKLFLPGNPVYEAGGTIEIRHLPRDG